MEFFDMIKARHSVRSYKQTPIEQEKKDILEQMIRTFNEKAGLHIQIFYDEPACFDSRMAKYGKFSGVNNYICMIGPKSSSLEEKLGYYGEQLVLKAQQLGLNTCWVAMTHGKSKAIINKGEKEVCIISLGYGETQGVSHKIKDISAVSNYEPGMPDWFLNGVNAALLAPTAMNQQKFHFELQDGNKVKATNGMGFYAKTDLGIVKFHFEQIAGKDHFSWA